MASSWISRILFRCSLGSFALLVLLGVVQSIQSAHSLPPVALDHQAEIKKLVRERRYSAVIERLIVAARLDYRDATSHFYELFRAAREVSNTEVQDHAIYGLRQTIQLQTPRDVRPYRYLADALLFHSNASEQDLREAVWLCQQALLRDPDYAIAHCNLGTAWLALGDRENAARHYRQALNLDPSLHQAKEGLQLTNQRQGQ